MNVETLEASLPELGAEALGLELGQVYVSHEQRADGTKLELQIQPLRDEAGPAGGWGVTGRRHLYLWRVRGSELRREDLRRNLGRVTARLNGRRAPCVAGLVRTEVGDVVYEEQAGAGDTVCPLSAYVEVVHVAEIRQGEV